MIVVFERCCRARGQCLCYPFRDAYTCHLETAADTGDVLPGVIPQQDLGALSFPLRHRTRSRQQLQFGQIFRRIATSGKELWCLRRHNLHSIFTPLRGCKWRSGGKLLKLHRSVFAAVDAMSFICNRRGDSQAGRRGFEPRLPLHLFNYLQLPPYSSQPLFEVTRQKENSELLDSVIFERLTGSSPRWPSYTKMRVDVSPDTLRWDER
jgi:hypothetical protein